MALERRTERSSHQWAQTEHRCFTFVSFNTSLIFFFFWIVSKSLLILHSIINNALTHEYCFGYSCLEQFMSLICRTLMLLFFFLLLLVLLVTLPHPSRLPPPSSLLPRVFCCDGRSTWRGQRRAFTTKRTAVARTATCLASATIAGAATATAPLAKPTFGRSRCRELYTCTVYLIVLYIPTYLT